jgi:hypothetical protein
MYDLQDMVSHYRQPHYHLQIAILLLKSFDTTMVFAWRFASCLLIYTKDKKTRISHLKVTSMG